MYVNHAEDTKPNLIFLSWPGGLRVLRWGLCGAMNRRGYSSTQGSKISKPEGFWEDGEGGCSGRVSGAAGVGFCSDPSTRIPWKEADLSRPRAPSSDWPGWASRCWSCSRGLRWFRHITLTRRDGLTAPAERGPTGSRDTALARVALNDRDTLGSDEHKCFPQNDVCFGNVLWVLTDRTWIHLKILLTN